MVRMRPKFPKLLRQLSKDASVISEASSNLDKYKEDSKEVPADMYAGIQKQDTASPSTNNIIPLTPQDQGTWVADFDDIAIPLTPEDQITWVADFDDEKLSNRSSTRHDIEVAKKDSEECPMSITSEDSKVELNKLLHRKDKLLDTIVPAYIDEQSTSSLGSGLGSVITLAVENTTKDTGIPKEPKIKSKIPKHSRSMNSGKSSFGKPDPNSVRSDCRDDEVYIISQRSIEYDEYREILDEVDAACWQGDILKMFSLANYDNIIDILDYILTEHGCLARCGDVNCGDVNDEKKDTTRSSPNDLKRKCGVLQECNLDNSCGTESNIKSHKTKQGFKGLKRKVGVKQEEIKNKMQVKRCAKDKVQLEKAVPSKPPIPADPLYHGRSKML